MSQVAPLYTTDILRSAVIKIKTNKMQDCTLNAKKCVAIFNLSENVSRKKKISYQEKYLGPCETSMMEITVTKRQ